MRITLKAINDELARRGVTERLARASGYFYFEFGEAAGWLDRTVRVPTVNALALDRLAGRGIPGTDLTRGRKVQIHASGMGGPRLVQPTTREPWPPACSSHAPGCGWCES